MNRKMMTMVATAAMAFAANAAKEYVDGYTWEYTVSGGAATVTGVEPASGDIVIPSTLGNVPVRTIGAYVFSRKGASSVIIPEGISRIEGYAFYGSHAMVTIPSTVTYIGAHGVSFSTIVKWTLSPDIHLDNYAVSSSMSSCVFFLSTDIPSCFVDGKYDTSTGVSHDRYNYYHLINAKSFYVKRAKASKWQEFFGYSKFAGYLDDAPEVEIVSAGVRENDPTVMDVVYKVYSDKASVKVRALAFQDGQRSLAKVVPVKTLIEGTDANIGDSVTANVEHKLSWKVSTDWATDLAKVKFEVLAVEDDILPLELQTIPATANHAAMKISWNKMTDDKVFDALLWLYASGDTGLTLTNGQLKYGGTILASGTGIYNGQSAVTYIFGKMGYGVLDGDNLTYARRVTQLDLPTSGVQQFAVKTIAQ